MKFLRFHRFRLRAPDGSVSEPLTRAGYLLRAGARMRKAHGPYQVGVKNRDLGPRKGLPRAIASLGRVAREAEVGEVVLVHPAAGPDIEARKVQIRQKVWQTSGNAKVDRFATIAAAHFGPLENDGALVCKTIGSTSTPSQHSDWPTLAAKLARKFGFGSAADSAGANAIDLFTGDRKTQTACFYWTIDQADEFGVANAIFWPPESPHPLIWNREHGLHEYEIPPGGSDHRFHQHTDFLPTRTPPTRC